MDLRSCPSPNYDDRRDGMRPSVIVLHYTGTRTAKEAQERFCDPSPTDSVGRISPHYMIDADGVVLQFVAEEKRAWHAGRAAWRGCTDLNSASIGIEIWNTGHEFDLEEFRPAQIESVIALIRDIRTRWDIPDRNIVGHSDVAPGRKLDPGEKFPWHILAKAGIGLMPRHGVPLSSVPAYPDFYNALIQYGYTYPADPATLLTEFRRHFCPHLLAGGGTSRGTGGNLGLVSAEDHAALIDILAQIAA